MSNYFGFGWPKKRKKETEFDDLRQPAEPEPTDDSENEPLAERQPTEDWLDDLVQGLPVIATQAWKAKAKALDPKTGEVREEMKKVCRHLDSILEQLRQMGLEVKDHCGEAFDYGLPLKVVTTQPTAGLEKEKVIETIKPTIYWHGQIAQMGEVIVATPLVEPE